MRKKERTFEECLEDNLKETQLCENQKKAWKEAEEEAKEFRTNEYREKRNKAEISEEKFNEFSSKLTEFSRRFSEAISPMLDLQQRLSDLNARINELYKEYVQIEGASGQIIWTVGWDQLLEEYKKLNPNILVNWTRLPIKEAELVSTVKFPGSVQEVGSISALKSALIPGAKPTGYSGLGKGEKVVEAQSQPSSSTEANSIFGNSIAGQIVLSLVGACPYFQDMNNKTSLNFNELTNHMTANLIYSYEVAALRGYSAQYNLSNLLRRIEENTKSGGFFSTQVAHNLTENKDVKDWFTINFTNNSKEFEYTAEEQKEITQTVKQELMDRAMQQFSGLNAGPSVALPLPQAEQNGAAMASVGLRKCMFWYCQAGSIILGIANSIWGKSEAVTNFHRNNNVWVTEKVQGMQIVLRSSSLAFKPQI